MILLVIRTVRCGECGKEVKKSRTTECMCCLERFHAGCLNKVRKRRISYRMCSICLDNNPSPTRTILDNEIDLEQGILVRTKPAI
jgi:hypothetical protein